MSNNLLRFALLGMTAINVIACVQPQEDQTRCNDGVPARCLADNRVNGYSGCVYGQGGRYLNEPERMCGACPEGQVPDFEGKGCKVDEVPVGCGPRECGDNPEGGPSCGTCESGFTCTAAGKCVATACVPDCANKACGDDGCGGMCQDTCAAADACLTAENRCVPRAWSCEATSYADGRACDCGCDILDPDCALAGATGPTAPEPLGHCMTGERCDSTLVMCIGVPVTWTCTQAQYADGVQCDCGCGAVDPDCATSLATKGGSNTGGACFSGLCTASGTCAPCTPACGGRNCGSDACGGLCLGDGPQPTTGPTAPSGGECKDNGVCTADGVCADQCDAENFCKAHDCGVDRCNRPCGNFGGGCAVGQVCNDQFLCGPPVVVPADNSCRGAGRCGNSAPSGCSCAASCVGNNNCCSDYVAACTCTPSCSAGSCGSDGCGGTCQCEVNNVCSVGNVCVPIAPTGLRYSANPVTYLENTPATTNVAFVLGGPVTSFAVSPPLPTGLTLNTSDGRISGTPTVVTAQAPYLVTASNAGGMSQVSVSIAVVVRPPAGLSYQSPVVYVDGSAITANAPSSTGGAITSYSVSPALPTGLVLNPSTGVISGTPSGPLAAAGYVVTATNASGTAQFTVNITVNVAAPAGLTYSAMTPDYSVNQAIPNNSPSSTGGAIASYSVMPALPTGLSLHPTTGVISGTPTVITGSASYIVTATNVTGTTQASLTIEIVATAPAPTGLTYSFSPATYVVGTAITPNTPSSTGGLPDSYVVSALTPLPAGLSIATGSGIITGTPSAVTGPNGHVITATNGAGSTQVTLTITINPTAPSGLTYTTPVVYTEGTPIAPNVPSSTGGAVTTYSIAPAAPTGLTLNPSNGVLSGTPTVGGPATNYSITATNVTGFDVFVINIKVVPFAWFCDAALYDDGGSCDCSCGAADPDCDTSMGSAVADTGCPAGVPLCDFTGLCDTITPVNIPICANEDQCNPGPGAFGPTSCQTHLYGGHIEFVIPPIYIGICGDPIVGAAEGAACVVNDDCEDRYCMNGTCSRWCVGDADCPSGLPCTEALVPLTPTSQMPKMGLSRQCLQSPYGTDCSPTGPSGPSGTDCGADECRVFLRAGSLQTYYRCTTPGGPNPGADQACTGQLCEAGLHCYLGKCRTACGANNQALECPSGTCTEVTAVDWNTLDVGDDTKVTLCINP